jgi:hypothetical protein
MMQTVRLIEEEELLEGLMLITDGNLGLSHELLKKVIQKTEWELKKTLQEMRENIAVEVRWARRRV